MRFHSPDISITAKEKTFFITIIAHAHELLSIVVQYKGSGCAMAVHGT